MSATVFQTDAVQPVIMDKQLVHYFHRTTYPCICQHKGDKECFTSGLNSLRRGVKVKGFPSAVSARVKFFLQWKEHIQLERQMPIAYMHRMALPTNIYRHSGSIYPFNLDGISSRLVCGMGEPLYKGFFIPVEDSMWNWHQMVLAEVSTVLSWNGRQGLGEQNVKIAWGQRPLLVISDHTAKIMQVLYYRPHKGQKSSRECMWCVCGVLHALCYKLIWTIHMHGFGQ